MPRHVPQPNKPDRAVVLRIAGEEAAATGASPEAVLGFNRAEGFDRGAKNITARHRAWARIIQETGCSQYGLALVVGCDRKAARSALAKPAGRDIIPPQIQQYGQPSRVGLTPAMRACLDAVLRLTTDGVPPSWAELGEVLSLKSRAGVTRVLRQLQARGYVDWIHGQARSLRVVHDGFNLARFPTDELLKIKRQVDAILANRSA